MCHIFWQSFFFSSLFAVTSYVNPAEQYSISVLAHKEDSLPMVSCMALVNPYGQNTIPVWVIACLRLAVARRRSAAGFRGEFTLAFEYTPSLVARWQWDAATAHPASGASSRVRSILGYCLSQVGSGSPSLRSWLQRRLHSRFGVHGLACRAMAVGRRR